MVAFAGQGKVVKLDRGYPLVKLEGREPQGPDLLRCEHVSGGLCGCRRGNAGDSQCHARDENETIMEETACSAANEMRDAPLPAENVRETEIFF